jgi:hypothetical protein
MLTVPPLPFWMLQRQIKAESVNDSSLRLAGPNLPTCDISLIPVSVGPGWRLTIAKIGAEGERSTVLQTEIAFISVEAAWQTAFELYRQHVIV